MYRIEKESVFKKNNKKGMFSKKHGKRHDLYENINSGSVTLIESAPRVDYTYKIPLPGKTRHFHQYLITSSFPSVTLNYTINLDGNYFLTTNRHRRIIE